MSRKSIIWCCFSCLKMWNADLMCLKKGFRNSWKCFCVFWKFYFVFFLNNNFYSKFFKENFSVWLVKNCNSFFKIKIVNQGYKKNFNENSPPMLHKILSMKYLINLMIFKHIFHFFSSPPTMLSNKQYRLKCISEVNKKGEWT